jgi:hypothetical protein
MSFAQISASTINSASAPDSTLVNLLGIGKFESEQTMTDR